MSILIKHIIHKIKHRRFCKLNNYFCPDCIYHDFMWEGSTFRGNRCRYPDETPSNADRIRAMTDEELAEMHVGVGCPPGTDLNELCFGENGEELLCTPPRCRECWLDWLRQEASDG